MNELLFENLDLPCGVTIKNRFFKSAMSEGLGDENYEPSDTLINLYKVWAEGGTGVLITGNVMIDKTALGEPSNVVIENEANLDKLKLWANAGTKNGTHFWLQLNHPGKQSPKFISEEPVAPSAIALDGNLGKYFAVPRELTEVEIEEIIAGFERASVIGKKAGFTGVQIHGAHGYLVSQFLSPKHNNRKDKWGGSLENRMRFVVEIYKAIRAKVGDNYPISIKLNSADFQKGGFTEEESKEVVKVLSDLGIDLIEISGGNYESPAMTGVKQRESTRIREAYFLSFASEIKRIVKCPVVVTGGFRSIEAMEEALVNKHTDMIGLARPLAIITDIPNRIQNQNYKTIKVPVINTGIKKLDNSARILETPWYERQLKNIGLGRIPTTGDIGIGEITKLIISSGVKIFMKKRA